MNVLQLVILDNVWTEKRMYVKQTYGLLFIKEIILQFNL